jgi:hypothetical protein
VNVDTAIALIGHLVYKPGWRFEPEDNRQRFENSIKVTIWYTATDSGRDHARDGYPDAESDGTPTIRPGGQARMSTVIMLDGLDNVSLYGELMSVILEIEEHEAREFLRVKPSYWAPFHPHQTDGMCRLAAVSGKSPADVRRADLAFGLA